MTPLIDRTVAAVRSAISGAISAAGWSLDEGSIVVETPRDPSHGDLATTVALVLAKQVGKNPREIAGTLQERIGESPPAADVAPLSSMEIAGPGFLNFRFAGSWLEGGLVETLERGSDYGQNDRLAGRSILFEFISANPTGPLNVVSARAAAIGDTLAALWQAAGARAGREYYINDAGRQVRLLGESLEARVLQLQGEEAGVPEEGYHGEYLVEMAERFLSGEVPAWWGESDREKRTEELSRWATDQVVAVQKEVVEIFGLQFDTWFRESSLHESGAVEETLEDLRSRGHIYESEGAVWFRSSDLGDEKDRVLVTGDGRPTYLLPDVAYHRDKYARGWETLIDLWGPDHHGYIARMSAALEALGHDREAFDVMIVQQVNLLRGGEIVKMSKRAGRLIEMAELLEEVGRDAARFFFLMRSASTPLDFDLDLAVSANEENPVYYVQYAHARISSVFEHARAEGLDPDAELAGADFTRLVEPEERGLMRLLVDFPGLVADAAETFEPHRIPAYLRQLSAAFHHFYHNHRVVGSEPEVQAARLALCIGVRQVLANGLALLGVEAPDRM